MPELPEVTTTVNGLRRTIVGKTIRDVWSDWKKQIKTPFPKFQKGLAGRKIIGLARRGKNILIRLSGGKTLLIHMKLTGHLMVGQYRQKGGRWIAAEAGPLRDDPYNQYIHFVVTFSNGKQLVFSDLRKFGKIKLLDNEKVDSSDDLKSLGPDAMAVSLKEFSQILARRPNGKIKQVLMDQNLIAGTGNIYSDEALWLSSIHPLSKAGNLTNTQTSKLYKSMRKVLKAGINFRGDSDSDYRDVYGRKGSYQRHHQAYGSEGEKCGRGDGGVIKRLKLGGRSAHFCPVHQKLSAGSPA